VKNLKDKVTNIVAILATVGAVINVITGLWGQYVAANPGTVINWPNLLIAVAIAVVAWFTGKGSDGKKVPV
jgi:Mg2+ and Co2+ transporter CorA